MYLETKHGITLMRPDEHKKLKRVGSNTLCSAVVIARPDPSDIYEEVDEDWTPEIEKM